MKKSTAVLDIFQPKTVSTSPNSNDSGSNYCFGFAFNNFNFSDKTLRIEILDDQTPAESKSSHGDISFSECSQNLKRRREQINITEACSSEVCHGENTSVARVRTIHINSAILAAKSPFFYKLFSNGMRESVHQHVKLIINACEETALVELLRFMYGNTLSATTPPALFDILIAADKYEVASCVKQCIHLLRNLPMTPDYALLYLDLPASICISMAEAVEPLVDAAKQYLVAHYRDVTKLHDELLKLPLVVIEAIFCSDDIQVESEDEVYEFIMKWAQVHFQDGDERKKVLATRLQQLIRFPLMSCKKLKEAFNSDIAKDFASEVILEALVYKADAPHRQRSVAGSESKRWYVERAYRSRPVKMVEFELPRQHCVVYMDLKREECANLLPSGWACSQTFHLGGHGFCLWANCHKDQESLFHHFGLYLGLKEMGSESCSVEFEFAARSRPTEDYVTRHKTKVVFTDTTAAVGQDNLFKLSWPSFMADGSPYFINDVLYLRAEIWIK